MLPTEVIVVDASDEHTDIKASRLPFKLNHITTTDSSISRQRNLGISLASKNSKYLSILDDDTFPEEEYFQKIINFLDQNDTVIGASGITFPRNEYLTRWNLIKLLKNIFFLDSNHSGSITKGGINVGVRSMDTIPLKVEWLIGCSVFRIERVRNLGYENSFDGYSLGEDVLFSYEAAKFGDLYLLPCVQINHLEESKSNHYQPDYWYRWSKNRKPLIRVMPGRVNKWLYYNWSNLGQILVVLLNPKKDIMTRLKSATKIVKGALSG